jgi:hypothetical protein
LKDFEQSIIGCLNQKEKIIQQLERGLRGASVSKNNAESEQVDLTRIKLLEEELLKFKQIITQQEDVILSQNNNLYVRKVFS